MRISESGRRRLAALRQSYRCSLPAKLDDLRICWRDGEIAGWGVDEIRGLHHRVHQLAGSAAGYGLEAVAEAAGELDQCLQDAAKACADGQVVRLYSVLRRELEQASLVDYPD